MKNSFSSENFTFLVSYPKSGNTFLRFLLANYLAKGDDLVTFKNINNYTTTKYDHENNHLVEIKGRLIDNAPIIFKEHQYYGNHRNINFTKCIYIHRQLPDVLNSYYHFTNAQKPGLFKNFEDFLNNYWFYCGEWGAHIQSWVIGCQENNCKMLMISYEELKSDPENTLIKICRFLDLEINREKIKKSVINSSRKNLSRFSSKEFMNSRSNNFHFVRDKNKFKDLFKKSHYSKLYTKQSLNQFWMERLYGSDSDCNCINTVRDLVLEHRHYPSTAKKLRMLFRSKIYNLRNAR